MTEIRNRQGHSAPDPIPVFKTRAEEAQFWDTHDFADYWDGFKPVEVRFEQNLSSGIMLHFDEGILARLYETARLSDTDVATLVRMWVMERLNNKEEVVP